MNHKRVYRLYREEGLSMRVKRPRRHVSAAYREGRVPPGCANDTWSMDFVSDSLFDGRRLRALTVVDNFTRQSLAIEVEQGIMGEQVVGVLDRIVAERGTPKSIRVDNGPEFISRVVDQWAFDQGVERHFIEPGKPVENAYIESFNGKFQDEGLNEHGFGSLEEAREKIEAWRKDYNQVRPHSALGYQTPEEFAAQAAARGASPPTPLALLPEKLISTPELTL